MQLGCYMRTAQLLYGQVNGYKLVLVHLLTMLGCVIVAEMMHPIGTYCKMIRTIGLALHISSLT